MLQFILSNACVTKQTNKQKKASKSIIVFKILTEAFNINNYNPDYSITLHMTGHLKKTLLTIPKIYQKRST
jgi:hypothetical protein